MKEKLYIKDKSGWYKEYHEPVQEYDNKLYRRVVNGGKVSYRPCSMLITDDLPEGVWVVAKHYGSKSITNGKYLYENYMCMKAGNLQDVSLAKLGTMEKYAHYLSQHLDEIPKDKSQYDLCRAIVGLLFKYEEENGKR